MLVVIINYCANFQGSVMVVAMKLISIGFDHQHDVKDVFGFYGYLFNPASVIFGPFVSYEDYLQLFHVRPLVTFLFSLYVLSDCHLLWENVHVIYNCSL